MIVSLDSYRVYSGATFINKYWFFIWKDLLQDEKVPMLCDVVFNSKRNAIRQLKQRFLVKKIKENQYKIIKEIVKRKEIELMPYQREYLGTFA